MFAHMLCDESIDFQLLLLELKREIFAEKGKRTAATDICSLILNTARQ